MCLRADQHHNPLGSPPLHLTSDKTVMCSVCGHDMIHQREVRTVWRIEDSNGICHSTSMHKESKEQMRSRDLPGRRDFIEIDFECESCQEFSTMFIQQEKGNTFIGWVK